MSKRTRAGINRATTIAKAEGAAQDDYRARARTAVEEKAAQGDIKSIVALTDGTLAKLTQGLEPEGVDGQGSYQTNDGPRWYGWTKCPCCHEPVYGVAWVTAQGLRIELSTAHSDSGRRNLGSAPTFVREYVERLDKVTWGVVEPGPTSAVETVGADQPMTVGSMGETWDGGVAVPLQSQRKGKRV